MAALPSGTVSFLFTDVEGSTTLWEQSPEAMRSALARHDELIRSAVEGHGGHVVKTTGDGFHVVFATAHDAVRAAVALQIAMTSEPWTGIGPLRVRAGIHTGSAEERSGDYYGTTVNRAARLMSSAHGCEIVCSHISAQLARDSLPDGIELRDLGEHRLRGLERREHVYQVVHPRLPSDFPPLTSVSETPGNLPGQATEFVGREDEIAHCADVVRQFGLVTLTGPPGVGKTRLAIQTASAVASEFGDGLWFVDLAAVDTGEYIIPAIASTLTLTEGRDTTGAGWIARALAKRRAVVILDNCEHVVEAAASVADELVHTCPQLTVIATTQELLGVDGERVITVRPLPVPDHPIDGPTPSVESIAANPSVMLFVERARGVREGFVLDGSSAAAVAELCARLDGIPLAIELAAARIGSMSPGAIVQRLDERFRLLAQGRRTARRRHQTLRAAVDWSYELLTPTEQRVFALLSVFAATFSIEAAEALACDEEMDALDLLDVLASLVAKSLVLLDDSGTHDRYRLLETMKDYGRERLAEAGTLDTALLCHARYYASVAAAAAPHLVGDRDTEWLLRLDEESPNLRAALGHFRAIGEQESFVRLVDSLARYWYLAGNLHEALEWISEALGTIHEQSAETAQLAAFAANAAVNLSRWDQTRAFADLSLRVTDAVGAGPRPLTMIVLGLMALVQNDPDEARRYGRDAVRYVRAEGSPFECAEVLSRASLYFALTSNDPTACELADESLEIAGTLKNDFAMSAALEAAGIARYRTDPARAVQLLDACMGISPIRDRANGGAHSQMMKAVAHLTLRQNEQAAQALLISLPIMRDSDEPYYETIALGVAAVLLRRTGRAAAATRVLATIDTLRTRGTIVGAPRDLESQRQLRDRLERELGHDAFTAAWAEGRQTSLDDMVTATLLELQTIAA